MQETTVFKWLMRACVFVWVVTVNVAIGDGAFEVALLSIPGGVVAALLFMLIDDALK